MRKKLFLAATMALAMTAFAAPAFADDTSGLQDLINDATPGSSISLSKDYVVTETVDVNKNITLIGNGHKISSSGSSYVFDVSADNVTLNDMEIDATSTGYGVLIEGNNATLEECVVRADERGVNFSPTVQQNAKITLNDTDIYNTEVDNYDSEIHAGDYRGLAVYNVKNGTIDMNGGGIYGFGYSVNALVDKNTNSNLRDGDQTDYNFTDVTIKGWTALNMWSANTNFTYTDCYLVGINTLDGSSNGFATIRANDGMYGGTTNKESVVTFNGGYILSKQYATALETPFTVDQELQTKFVFNSYDESKYENSEVSIEIYTSEDTAYLFNFMPGTDGDSYLASDKVQGLYTNVLISAWPISAVNSLALILPETINSDDVPITSTPAFIGGDAA